MLTTGIKGVRSLRSIVAGAVAMGVLSAASSAFAGTLTLQNYDTFIAPQIGGNLVLHTTGPTTDFFENIGVPGSAINGTIQVTVYQDSSVGPFAGDATDGTYVYVITIVPDHPDNNTNGFASFGTNFEVFPIGLDVVAGWSFSDATAAGANTQGNGSSPNTATVFSQTLLGPISWNYASGGFWQDGESIRFFFRDPRKPSSGRYSLRDGFGGNAVNLAPIPEPSTFALLGLGVLGLAGGAWRRRNRKAAAPRS